MINMQGKNAFTSAAAVPVKNQRISLDLVK